MDGYGVVEAAVSTAVGNTTAEILIPESVSRFLRAPLKALLAADRFVFRSLPSYVLRITGIYAWLHIANNNLNEAGRGAGEQGPEVVDIPQGVMAFFAALRTAMSEAFHVSNVRSYGGMLYYITSRWAFVCMTLAIILNRVTVYAFPRRRLKFGWETRLALRLVPALLLCAQLIGLLQTIRCQNSPHFAKFRYGDTEITSPLDWHTDGGFLYDLSARLLFLSSDGASCRAVGMSQSDGPAAHYGSFSRLWPVYLSLCLCQFIDVIFSTMTKTTAQTEVGMSIFEHSLAFAEIETMVMTILGLGLFGKRTSGKPAPKVEVETNRNMTIVPVSAMTMALSDATSSLSGSRPIDRLNIPSEVLLICLLSCGNALTHQVIAIFDKQHKLRLINTAFWGSLYMASFFFAYFSHTPLEAVGGDDSSDFRFLSGLLHFPTVCIIGFVPHMLLLVGSFVCLSIYGIAISLNAINVKSPAAQQLTVAQRFQIANANLQAGIQSRSFELKLHEDFYTAICRVSWAMLMAASEAVFLHEGRAVEVRQLTWVEEDRIDEIAALRSGNGIPSSGFQIAEQYGRPGIETEQWKSGYGRERKLEQESQDEGKMGKTVLYPHPRTNGVGTLQRTTRFFLLYLFLRGVFFLLTGWTAYLCGIILDRIGITHRPRWLEHMVGKSLRRECEAQADSREAERVESAAKHSYETLWIGMNEGTERPEIDDLDIEPELRQQLAAELAEDEVENALDFKLYRWWTKGGWFGTVDSSGDYKPPLEDDFDDTTSVISMATTTDTTDDEQWESESDGRRTPTRHDPGLTSAISRVNTPIDAPMDVVELRRLLSPRSEQDRDDARILSAHLGESESSTILTRSRYRELQQSKQSRLLLAGRRPLHGSPNDPTNPRPLTAVEEAEVLETLILERRKGGAARDAQNSEEEEFRGPACVVCQSSPRTIISWPCRCLCLCDDCRVSLALRSTGKCVTCRRDVQGFVRLWIP